MGNSANMMQQCSLLKTFMQRSRNISISSIKRLSTSQVCFNDQEAALVNQNQNDEQKLSRRDYRFIFPEFLPDPNPAFRNAVAERLQRKDLLSRRDQVEIPGLNQFLNLFFYVCPNI